MTHPSPIDDLLLSDEEIRRMDRAELEEYAATLAAARGPAEFATWRQRARPEQLPPDGDWTRLLYIGGRGSGKTHCSVRVLLEMVRDDPLRDSEGPGTFGAVGPTFTSARAKLVEGEAGLLAALGTTRAEVDAGGSALVKTWNRSTSGGELVLRDGTQILIDGANDGAPSINGENLRGCLASELGIWRNWERAWDESIGFAVRKGHARIVAEGTPKRIMSSRKLIRRLLDDPDVVVRRLRTIDNRANLSPTWLAQQLRQWEGTQLGKQELEGILLEEVEGALWKQSIFDRPGFRATTAPTGGWLAPVTGVDLSDGTAEGAAHAYATVSRALDNYLYVIASKALRVTPYEFACEVVRHSASIRSRIQLEKNHGGAWAVEVFNRAMRDLKMQRPLKVIHASQGKRMRAEPVAAMYEPRHVNGQLLPGRVRHVGAHDELESQMTGWSGAPGEDSPDVLDAAVWAMAEFTSSTFEPPPPESEDVAVPYTEGTTPDGAVPWGGVEPRLGTWEHAFGSERI